MDQILIELNLERFIEPFKQHQIDFNIFASINITAVGLLESLHMDKYIENILFKKCGID